MLTTIDCLPCFLRQAVIALKQRPAPKEVQTKIMKEIIAIMQEADLQKPPAYTTTFIHREIRNGLGEDPFSHVKTSYNELAMGLYPELKEKIRRNSDPLRTAARVAIAGNVIDFGIFTTIDMEGSLNRSLEAKIAVDDFACFREFLGSAKSVLYLLDNAGEIAFDRLLIEEILLFNSNICAVVKGSPVLNDATIEDAQQIGLTDVCRIIDNGSDAVGTIFEWTSPEFQEEFNKSDLIVSKGQGNFETLTGTTKEAYFLFQSKCDVVSKELGLSPGSMLLKKS